MNGDYQPPVDRLLSLGECRRGHRDWPDYVAAFGFGPEHVPDLVRMATDAAAPSIGDDSALNHAQGVEVWAPTHAWRALAQLRAADAVEPLIAALPSLADDDWALEELPIVLAQIGEPAIGPLAKALGDREHDIYPRIAAAEALAKIGVNDPRARDLCLAPLARQLGRFEGEDHELNAFLVSYLLDLRAVEAAPVMERAFAADAVDLAVCGDWEDVQIELGLLDARVTPAPAYSPPQISRAVVAVDRLAAARQGHRSMDEALGPPSQPQPSAKAKAKAKAKRRMAKASRRRNRRRK